MAKFRQGARAPENVYIVCHTAKDRAKFGWPPRERRRCSNEAKTRNPLKFAAWGVRNW